METFLNNFNPLLSYDYSGIIFFLQFLAFNISFFCLWGIVYSISKTLKIFNKVHVFDETVVIEDDANKKVRDEWGKIITDASSEDENKRKIALIAADSLVEKILALAGYSGENLGERLKKIETGDLNSLDNLWEAHKTRNRIAHDADYKLSKEDAQQAIKDFEKVLRELEYI